MHFDLDLTITQFEQWVNWRIAGEGKTEGSKGVKKNQAGLVKKSSTKKPTNPPNQKKTNHKAKPGSDNLEQENHLSKNNYWKCNTNMTDHTKQRLHIFLKYLN